MHVECVDENYVLGREAMGPRPGIWVGGYCCVGGAGDPAQDQFQPAGDTEIDGWIYVVSSSRCFYITIPAAVTPNVENRHVE